jgi:calcineurin-like phosphoesterase family protein
MARIWFSADLHFDHRNVIALCQRPFKDLPTMHRALAREWNSIVHPRDTVYVLGDVAFGKRPSIPELRGKKVLIRGNHDEWRCPEYPGWTDGGFFVKLKHERRTYILTHHPFENWRWGRGRPCIHLHGHSHGNGKSLPMRLDVGIDSVVNWIGSYRPVSLDEVLQRLGA